MTGFWDVAGSPEAWQSSITVELTEGNFGVRSKFGCHFCRSLVV